MADPFLAELRLMSFNFPPKGWAMCNGQLLPINQNQPLFALLGTTYGGDGRVNFALPNLRGRAPMHFGNGFTLGQQGGEESHTVTMQEMAAHNHFVSASSSNGDRADIGALAGLSEAYGAFTDTTTLHPATVTNTGGSQPHNNLQPYIVLNWCVALQGIFPSQN
jgi:microcystin-dependent protein